MSTKKNKSYFEKGFWNQKVHCMDQLCIIWKCGSSATGQIAEKWTRVVQVTLYEKGVPIFPSQCIPSVE